MVETVAPACVLVVFMRSRPATQKRGYAMKRLCLIALAVVMVLVLGVEFLWPGSGHAAQPTDAATRLEQGQRAREQHNAMIRALIEAQVEQNRIDAAALAERERLQAAERAHQRELQERQRSGQGQPSGTPSSDRPALPWSNSPSTNGMCVEVLAVGHQALIQKGTFQIQDGILTYIDVAGALRGWCLTGPHLIASAGQFQPDSVYISGLFVFYMTPSGRLMAWIPPAAAGQMGR